MIIILLLSNCSSYTTKKNKINNTRFISYEENDNIIFFYKDKQVGEMTKDEFKAVIQASQNYNKELDAELSDPKRVEVVFLKKPWVIKKSEGMYKTQIKINWIDKDNTIFKSITIELNLTIDKLNTFPKWRTIYRDIAEIGFPTVFIILMIMVML